MNAVNIIFPHQLFEDHELYLNGHPIYLVEEYLFFKHFNFHKTKIAFHRASMKCFENQLKSNGLNVTYIDSTDESADIRKLVKKLADENVKTINSIDPTDNWLERRLKSAAEDNSVELNISDNPQFINSRDELGTFFKPDKKSFFQTSFYKKERVKRNVLIEADDQPVGGKWSFDGDNRKKYPKGKIPPTINFPDKDSYWEEAVSYVEKHYSDNLGEVSDSPLYPYSTEKANQWLQQFFEFRFHGFGDYEDAIVDKEPFLNHSILTPMLNVGLLQPMNIIRASIAFAEQNDVPINSLEGFVRQIMGWREFIRGMYECKGVESRNKNFWGFERKIPASFYDGTTGIVPVDDTIKKILKTGYCHHIERLMVLGNFMLLCEFHPKEVYRWFMELFIDAYDWVMVPNVYGMSQFADGGFFATKPYISGSNYLMKMSNYKKGDWQEPWDGLFWRFMHINRDFFLKNPRLGMLVRTFDKMDEEKRKKHLNAAEQFLEELN
ncbi:MAG: cryptochrome/photolyase family protein [Bacteroidota bacterium]